MKQSSKIRWACVVCGKEVIKNVMSCKCEWKGLRPIPKTTCDKCGHSTY